MHQAPLVLHRHRRLAPGVVQGIIGALTILELTPHQKAYQQTVAAFAAERVAPIAARIDEDGTFPGALIKEAGALGLSASRFRGRRAAPAATT